MKILDVGCGAAKKEGATGIDVSSYPCVDIVYDLNKYPWPIPDSSFDIALCKDVVEHLDNTIGMMEELHRVLKPGGKIIIYTPHFSNPNSFRDPTHKHHFSYGTFDYFTGDISYPVYSKKKFKMLKKEFIFRKPYALGKWLAKLSTIRYEKYYCHRSPPHGLYFEIEVIKC